jgi:GGDEF domain-containing protein
MPRLEPQDARSAFAARPPLASGAEALRVENGAPVQAPLKVRDAIRERFDQLSGVEKIREYYYDPNTGLPNERGVEALHGGTNEAAPQFAHFSIEGVKFVNDTFGHDQGQLLYRMAADALHAVDPKICKVKGDFATRVASRERANLMEERANALLPPELAGFKITVSTGPTLEAAVNAHGDLKVRMEKAGVRALRGGRPHGLDAGWDPAQTPFPARKVDQPPHVELTKAYWQLDRETALEAYRDPMTGLLSSTGMGAAARPGDRILSIDVDGLKATDGFNSGLADEVILRTGALMKLLGGEELQAAHPHGDEYAAAHPDLQVLQTYAEQLVAYLGEREVCYTNVDLGVTFVQRGIGLSYGIGDSHEAAERALEQHKLERTLAGERDQRGELDLARGRLFQRPATERELREARNRGRRSREHQELRRGSLEPEHVRGGERGAGARGRDGVQAGLEARHIAGRAREAGPGGAPAPQRVEGERQSLKPERARPPHGVEQGRGGDSGPAARGAALAAKGIRPETLGAPPFRARWHEDARGNVVFPQERSIIDAGGTRQRITTGVELAIPAGESATLPARGLWESAAQRDVARIVVTERAIDALSHYQLKPDEHTLYVSTGGPLTPEQAPALTELLKRQEALACAAGAPAPTLVAAFSNSREGAALARQVETSLPPGMRFERDVPTWGRDWNETLQAKERDRTRQPGMRPQERAPLGRALDLRR